MLLLRPEAVNLCGRDRQGSKVDTRSALNHRIPLVRITFGDMHRHWVRWLKVREYLTTPWPCLHIPLRTAGFRK